MKYVLSCRRTFLAVLAIAALILLGLVNGTDVSTSIAAVAVGLAAANAGQASLSARREAPSEQP